MKQTSVLILARLLVWAAFLGVSAPALSESFPDFSFASGASESNSIASGSKRRFFLELHFGAYLPHLDETKSLQGRTPFSDFFGDPNAPQGAPPGYGLLTKVEFDYQFFHHKTGSLGVGLSAGYYRKTAPAFAMFPGVTKPGVAKYCSVQPNATDPQNGPKRFVEPVGGKDVPYDACVSGDENIINIFPIELLFIYRFNYFQHRWNVPIIPYLKAGVGYYFWWFGNTGSFVTDAPNGQASSGSSGGLVFHPGIAVNLGGIDREAGQNLYRTTGIHQITAFFEVNGAWVDGFTSPNKLNLSDISFTAGLGLEF